MVLANTLSSFHNNFRTELACAHFSVFFSIFAVRIWKVDFYQQEHISGAQRWMATVGQVAGEAASHSMEFYGICKDSYTKWKTRPRPLCDCDSEGADVFDWCCLYYSIRNSLVALLGTLFARFPIMFTSPTITGLFALRLEHVQTKLSVGR